MKEAVKFALAVSVGFALGEAITLGLAPRPHEPLSTSGTLPILGGTTPSMISPGPAQQIAVSFNLTIGSALAKSTIRTSCTLYVTHPDASVTVLPTQIRTVSSIRTPDTYTFYNVNIGTNDRLSVQYVSDVPGLANSTDVVWTDIAMVPVTSAARRAR